MLAAGGVLLNWWTRVARRNGATRLDEDLEPLRRCRIVAREWLADPSAGNALLCITEARRAWGRLSP